MSEITNPIQACNEIFTKPTKVFPVLAEKNNWSWVPFLILVVFSALPSYLYFNSVDPTWYKELVITAQFADVSPAEQQQIRDNMPMDFMAIASVFGSVLGMVIINALFALYLNAIAKQDETHTHGFSDWYGFNWWATLPSIIGAVGSLLAILLLNGDGLGQIPPEAIAPTSLGFVFGVDLESAWFGLMQNLRLEYIFNIYLTAVGIACWTDIPWKKAINYAILPYAAIYGIWTIFVIF